MKKHAFHSKDEHGVWMVFCRETRGSFSTALWKAGVIPDQSCACCGDDMNATLESDGEALARNTEKYGHASITGAR